MIVYVLIEDGTEHESIVSVYASAEAAEAYATTRYALLCDEVHRRYFPHPVLKRTQDGPFVQLIDEDCGWYWSIYEKEVQ